MSLSTAPAAALRLSNPEAVIPFSDAEFARIRSYAHAEFGLALQDNKKPVIHSRLIRLLGETNSADIATFCTKLESGNFPAIREALVIALTTNVTAFFREAHHFEQFGEEIVKPMLPALKSGKRLRIWSAGCSAGQEPLTIAMRISELLPDAHKLNVRILATDLDPAIVAKARSMTYSCDEAPSIPAKLREAYTRPIGSKSFTFDQKISSMIHFGELNLVQSWPIRGPFDAIFCRNVAIYFDKPTQAQLWSRFAKLLRPGGMLFIGHSERVSGPAASILTSAGITAYRLAAPQNRRYP